MKNKQIYLMQYNPFKIRKNQNQNFYQPHRHLQQTHLKRTTQILPNVTGKPIHS